MGKRKEKPRKGDIKMRDERAAGYWYQRNQEKEEWLKRLQTVMSSQTAATT